MARTSINQIILFVKICGAVRFYRDLLGLKYASSHLEDVTDEMWVEPDGGACSLALHGGADEAPVKGIRSSRWTT